MEKKVNYKNLLQTNNKNLNKLNDIVLKAVEEEQFLTKKLKNEKLEQPKTIGEKLSDRVATFGGSWRFIIIFSIFLALWMMLNVFILSNKGYDPYPFILLNLILSTIAAIQAPVIMMSQNRKEERDRRRSEDDYMVNLKSEIELRNLHEKIDLLIAEQMKDLFEIQKAQIGKIDALDKKLKDHLKSVTPKQV
ncbi:MAG: DUF1003 domain-containing protein [Bacteroidetes bacterium]|nr:DUF1003 domain-containing protein [Bacteroidota bacterium]MBU1371812.1 DUF1003 domain-containing protein [Bacteroidota bacterium]MBU1483303.1 DUF1003 domain-containing protein [Bacteroidota bacterium]MBU1760273.1 DUF1003 domain-containing protein [Bacteroidota bacterium]MBU2267271.1 DUF1003 domain-containing protein [Bacteroidota bacterium]